jgi:WD40 repeat protein
VTGGCLPDTDGCVITAGHGAHFSTGMGEETVAVYDNTSRRLLVSGALEEMHILDAGTGRVVTRLAPTGEEDSAAFSRDGSKVVTGGADGTITLWDASSGQRLQTITLPLGPDGQPVIVLMATFSPDGSHVVVGAEAPDADVVELSSGQVTARLGGHSEGVGSVRYSPDGANILTASHDGLVRLWDASSDAPLRTLEDRGSPVINAAYSPDGRRVAIASHDGTVKILDSASGATTATLVGDPAEAMDAEFSPDSARIATIGASGRTRLWDASTGTLLCVLDPELDAYGDSAQFSPDGAHLAVGFAGGHVMQWSVGLETRTPTEIAALVAAKVAYRLDDSGRLVSVGATNDNAAQ